MTNISIKENHVHFEVLGAKIFFKKDNDIYMKLYNEGQQAYNFNKMEIENFNDKDIVVPFDADILLSFR